MMAEGHTSQPGAETMDTLPWWNVRHPHTLQLYVGLCWAFTPLALTYIREHGLLGQHPGIGLMVAGLVWVVGHAALISYALRMHLIQRLAGRLLFITAVILASVAIDDVAILILMPETILVSDIQLLGTAPHLLAGALALLSLSSRYSSPRPPTPHT